LRNVNHFSGSDGYAVGVTSEAAPAGRTARRPATEEEARAMASATRLRIFRLCLGGALTNKEIAARLGKDPATVLYHVRRLVDTGFLVAEPVRRGVRGSREVPYRATGKSWVLDVVDEKTKRAGSAEMFEAFLADVRAVGAENLAHLTRLGVRLTERHREELGRRLQELFDEYARRPPDPDSEPWGLFFATHPDPRPLGNSGAWPGVPVTPSEDDD
jgi:DNA-binding transcriptional ArsR family regulator